MESNTSPLIIGFGYKAKSGKDECCKAIVAKWPWLNIKHYAFADTLRDEVNAAVFDQWIQDFGTGSDWTPLRGMWHLCEWAGVEFDTNAEVSDQYPHGKQRALLQWWGQWRREQDPDYWIKKLKPRIDKDAESSTSRLHAAISDLRKLNEFAFCDYQVKVNRPNCGLDGEQAKHSTETELDSIPDSEWTKVIQNDGPLWLLQERAIETFAQLAGIQV